MGDGPRPVWPVIYSRSVFKIDLVGHNYNDFKASFPNFTGKFAQLFPECHPRPIISGKVYIPSHLTLTGRANLGEENFKLDV